MMSGNHCHVIGILESGIASLQAQVIQIIKDADLIVGSPRQTDLVAELVSDDCEVFSTVGNLGKTPEKVRNGLSAQKKVVILATGDPLCHGVGGYLLGKLGSDKVVIWPNLSALQLAAARTGTKWESLSIQSIHSGTIAEWNESATPEHGMYPLRQALEEAGPWGIFTAKGNGPDKIARMLIIEGLESEFVFDICCHLGAKEEQVILNQTANFIQDQSYPDPNFVILKGTKAPQKKQLFGREEEEFALRKPDKGLITKKEVRATALGLMNLKSNSLVWDIGAGSGSVGIEAATLCSEGHVWAIEKNEKDFANVIANRKSFKLFNYSAFLGKAPETLESWLAPNAVFIGGSGGNLAEIIRHSFGALQTKGRLVAAFVTIENMHQAQTEIAKLTSNWGLVQLQVSRSKPILNMTRFEASQPVWLLWAEKEGEANG